MAGVWRTADEAVSLVEPGMTLALCGASAEPLDLLEALSRRADECRDLTILTGMLLDGYAPLADFAQRGWTIRTWFMPGTLTDRDVSAEGFEFLPLTWSQVWRYLRETHIDVAFTHVTPADDQGRHSLGISTSHGRVMIEAADTVIAQVNTSMPFTYGDASMVPADDLDVLVETDRPLVPFPHRAGDERDREIARHVVGLVPDGAAVQVGIGTIPSMVLAELASSGVRGLRLHSQVTEAGRPVLESEAATVDVPAARVGEIVGSTELYDWSNRNERIEMIDAARSHSVDGVRGVEKLVSINSALEVDLLGQVNSEWLGGSHVGGIGGSVDFAIAGQIDGNLCIVALPSTTRSGRSRIVERLGSPGVTVSRTFLQFVVTDHGVADLRNKSVRERARAIAAISDPAHRDALMAVAQ